MTLKHYHYLQNIISFSLIIVIFFYTSENNFIIPLIAMVSAFAIIFIAKRYVKEVVQDERDISFSNQAFRLAVYGYAFIAVVTIILLSFGIPKAEYQIIFVTFIVSICLIFFLQKLFYVYYQKMFVEKREIYIAFGVLILILTMIFMLRFFSGEDDWICQDGQWVKHGNPEVAMPSSKCR